MNRLGKNHRYFFCDTWSCAGFAECQMGDIWGSYAFFFMISGYLKSSASGKDGRQKAMKKIINGLLIPYLIYCSAITLLYVVVKGGSIIIPNILIANYAALVGDYTSICPLWFLVSLITIKVIDLFIENPPVCHINA